MSDQSNQAAESALTPQELRQHLLDSLNEAQQTIEELSSEELEMVSGGGAVMNHYQANKSLYQRVAATAVIAALGSTLSAWGVHR
jgi:uridylate kinase